MSESLTALEVYKIYEEFQRAGFNEDQAFELAKTWMVTIITTED